MHSPQEAKQGACLAEMQLGRQLQATRQGAVFRGLCRDEPALIKARPAQGPRALLALVVREMSPVTIGLALTELVTGRRLACDFRPSRGCRVSELHES